MLLFFLPPASCIFCWVKSYLGLDFLFAGCYFGPHDDALSFFGVTDVVDIYSLITEKAPFWRDRYRKVASGPVKVPPAVQPGRRTQKNRLRQLGVLCARYAKLVSNDRQSLLLFSGLIFKLDGVTESISWFALCRWSKVIAVIVLILVVGGGVFAWQTLHSPAYALKGVVEDVLIAMKKEDNTWKIDSFDLADFSLQDASQSAQDKES